jgi:hypothetical protein
MPLPICRHSWGENVPRIWLANKGCRQLFRSAKG